MRVGGKPPGARVRGRRRHQGKLCAMSEKRQANGESAGATAVGGERMKQRSPLRARAAEETKRRFAPLKAPRVPRISRWGREREGGGRVRRRHVSPREPPAPSPPAICGRGRAANACRRRRRPEPDRMGGFGGIVPPSLKEGRAACACLGVAPTGGAPAAARGAQPPPLPARYCGRRPPACHAAVPQGGIGRPGGRRPPRGSFAGGAVSPAAILRRRRRG